jgi:hypothetical protein
MFKHAIVCLFLVVSAYAQAPVFTQAPAMAKINDSSWRIDFTLDRATDVEVSVVDIVSGEMVRHLAAGLLGPSAPQPFVKDSLHQVLFWNGRNDLGQPAASPGDCRVRVRAGVSLALDAFVGESYYKFHRCIGGVAADSAGNLFAFGSYPRPMHHGTTMMTLRKYNSAGEYQKTVWPFPAGLNAAALGPFGIVTLPGNKYIPRTEAVDVPQFGGMPLSYEDAFMLPELVDGALLVYDRMALRYFLVREDGTVLDTGRLVSSPALPSVSRYYGPWYAGPVFLSVSPDRSYFLLSGYYASNNPTFPTNAWFPSDTGFWREGQVFKVDAATGAAAPFISIAADSLPKTDSERRAQIGPAYVNASLHYMAAFHGTAFDDSGHVFVCDRLRGEVGVYDTNGVKAGAIPVTDPDVVAVSKKTGAVYVLTRNIPAYRRGTAQFLKYSTWRSGGGTPILAKALRPAGSLAKATAVQSERPGAPNVLGRLNMTVNESGAQPVIWLNGLRGTNCLAESTLTNIRALRDDGNTLAVLNDFYPRAHNLNTGFDHVVVDRKSETVYFNDSWDKAYKIEDWESPVMTRCSLSTGGPLSAAEFHIGNDGCLWVWEFGYPTAPVKRFTQDHLHAPAPFAGLGTHIAVPSGLVSQGFGAGTKARGLTVLPDGRVLIYNGAHILKVFDSTGTLLRDSLIFPINQSGGLKSDPQGSFYTGILLRSPDHVIPPEYSGYWPYTSATGAVVKFDPNSGGAIQYQGISDPALRTADRALKVYTSPLSPFTGYQPLSVYVPSGSGSCICRSPRFDVDPYGRLFMPHTVICQVTVADNEGNELAAFGEYGNVDSRGPGSLVPGPVFPMAWPVGVAASEDYIYVTDLVNARLMRVRMNYALDNLPGFTDRRGRVGAAGRDQALMRAAPNPFNGRVTIRFSAGIDVKNARIGLYSADGRLIREFHPVAYRAVWDGRDANGRPMPSGIYFCRYEGKTRRGIIKICFLQ